MSNFSEYNQRLNHALFSVYEEKIEEAIKLITDAMKKGIPIFTFGNGGSCAIAEHFTSHSNMFADKCKNLQPWITNLTTRSALLTAVSNDCGYEHIFEDQILWCGSEEALVIGISSSGNSQNIVNGFYAAIDQTYESIALVGFDGGKVLSENLADTIIHVKSNMYDYGVVEDAHQIILHFIAERIIINNSNPQTV